MMISPREFAVRYGCSYKAVISWMKNGKLGFTQVGRRKYIVDPGDVVKVTGAPNAVKDVDQVPLLRGKELAEILGISSRRVRQLVELGHLSCRVVLGRRRYSVNDLRKILAYRDARSKLANGDNSKIRSSAKETREVLKRWAMVRATQIEPERKNDASN